VTTEEFDNLLYQYRAEVRYDELGSTKYSYKDVIDTHTKLLEAFDQMRMAAEDDRGVL
jgi:hypothetical protein